MVGPNDMGAGEDSAQVDGDITDSNVRDHVFNGSVGAFELVAVEGHFVTFLQFYVVLIAQIVFKCSYFGR